MQLQEPPQPDADAGLTALVRIARYHGLVADPLQLRHDAARPQGAFDEGDLVCAARSLGLRARAVALVPERLAHTPLPAIALDDAGRHCMIGACQDEAALVLVHVATVMFQARSRLKRTGSILRVTVPSRAG